MADKKAEPLTGLCLFYGSMPTLTFPLTIHFPVISSAFWAVRMLQVLD